MQSQGVFISDFSFCFVFLCVIIDHDAADGRACKAGRPGSVGPSVLRPGKPLNAPWCVVDGHFEGIIFRCMVGCDMDVRCQPDRLIVMDDLCRGERIRLLLCGGGITSRLRYVVLRGMARG
jgi:hypothetical protein